MTTIEAPKTTPKEAELAEEALRLSAQATPGPWSYNGAGGIGGNYSNPRRCLGFFTSVVEGRIVRPVRDGYEQVLSPTPGVRETDAEFIVRARTLLPLLAQALLRQAAERSRETA